MNKQILVFASLTVFVLSLLWAQEQKPQSEMSHAEIAGHDMSKVNRSDTDDMPGMDNNGAIQAMHSMQGHHMNMGAHMKMTAVRDAKPDDQQRADQVVQAARRVAEKYVNYRDALADRFKIFMPNQPQKQYHFTNYSYAFEAASHFNPDHPTSLLYEKHGDDYKLVGVMYTAPKNATEDELNSRIPLSVAQWHAHVNLCLPPQDRRGEATGPHPRFGLVGSIATQEECAAAGGEFIPQIFGWMMHVYPFEQKAADVWSVERQQHLD
jgi:hypothetical protein